MLSIRNPVVERLAREISERERIGITEVILHALEEHRVLVMGTESPRLRDRAAIEKIKAKAAKLPVLDARSTDEILGYGPTGTFE